MFRLADALLIDRETRWAALCRPRSESMDSKLIFGPLRAMSGGSEGAKRAC